MFTEWWFVVKYQQYDIKDKIVLLKKNLTDCERNFCQNQNFQINIKISKKIQISNG